MQKTKPLVSVIVPVYNVKAYINQCVDSIIQQTYQNLEIILVDDGSTDGSEHICDTYKEKDPRVLVFHQTNGGLSSARNVGIEHASGDRLIFIDSDDYWASSNLIETIVSCIDGDNLIIWRYQRCRDDDAINTNFSFEIENYSLDSDFQFLLGNGILFASACYLAIPTEWFNHQNLRFEIGALSEDVEWFAELIFKIKKITLINAPIYVYRIRQQSISNSRGEIGTRYAIAHVKNLVSKYADFKSEIMNTYLAEQIANLVIILSRGNFTTEQLNEVEHYLFLLKYAVRKRSRIIALSVKLCGLKRTLSLLQLVDLKKKRIYVNSI